MSQEMCILVGDMAQKGLTKKQFWIQMFPMAFFMLLAVYWIVRGVFHESAVEWIIGALYCVLILANTIHLIIQRKRHPVDDPQLDEQAVGNFKVGLKGMGIVFAFITVGFLIAIGLAAIMS